MRKLKRLKFDSSVGHAKLDDAIARFNRWQRATRRTDELRVAIYVLLDPRDGTVRYVGQTVNPGRRRRQHREAGRRKWNRQMAEWTAELRAAMLSPEMVVIDWVSRAEWRAKEKAWVAHFASCGRLYNICPGGIVKRRRSSQYSALRPENASGLPAT